MQVEPNAPLSQWLNDSAGAAQQVAQGLDWETGGWVVAGLTALGLITRFGPAFGPVGSAISGAIRAIGGIVKPGSAKEAERRAQVAEESLWGIVEVIEQVSPDDPIIKQLKKAINEKTPAAFNTLFEEWKERRQGA